MSGSRRRFLRQAGLLPLSALAGAPPVFRSVTERKLLKPPRLKPGDAIGLVSPGGAIFWPEDVRVVEATLADLGLKTRLGPHALDRRGYMAGTDHDRAHDLNQMFADPEIDAILALRGGWGCNRILSLLDYDLIRENPKILVGFSDITSLLLAIYARSRVVTFHGPVGISTWNDFTVDHFRRVLFNGLAVEIKSPTTGAFTPIEKRTHAITPGKATGPLAGGNLSVLAAMIGSEYLPDWRGHILFLEDTGEDIYRVDRMLTQLKLAGVLDQIAGFVFGKCTDCEAGEVNESLTLEEVYHDHIRPLGIPAFYGATIGHITDKFTLPVGGEVRMDASTGSIEMLEPAVL